MYFQHIPNELKALNQWACYKTYLDKKENKYKKVIISPVTNEFAKSNEPDTWDTYEHAKYYCQKYKYQGLVFVLTEGITFIDIDHAIDKETGEMCEEAKELLQLFPDTFTEKSVSGSGIHILIKGSLPENALKRKGNLEMYDTKRFICMTGDLLNDTISLADYSDKIAEINYKFIGRRKEPVSRTTALTNQTDSQLIEAISKSRQGAKFQRLYSGDTSSYPTHSQADFALASILAWWTEDFGQIERIFRSSGLMREKFDRRTGNSTYGINLIIAALNSYTGQQTHRSNAIEM